MKAIRLIAILVLPFTTLMLSEALALTEGSREAGVCFKQNEKGISNIKTNLKNAIDAKRGTPDEIKSLNDRISFQETALRNGIDSNIHDDSFQFNRDMRRARGENVGDAHLAECKAGSEQIIKIGADIAKLKVVTAATPQAVSQPKEQPKGTGGAFGGLVTAAQQKAATFGPPGGTKCAEEDGDCTIKGLPGERFQLHFGAHDKWATVLVYPNPPSMRRENVVNCSNRGLSNRNTVASDYAGDPIVNVKKACYLQSTGIIESN